MYGHGAAPPPRSFGAVIVLRVLFATAGFLSCGLLACVPLFRVAVLRDKWTDWLLAWISIPVSIGFLVVVGSVPESDYRSDVAIAAALILGAASGAYFVTFDIRHHRALPPTGMTPPPATAYAPPQPGYGYPAAAPYPATPPAQTPPPLYPPPPQPQRPAPARIDQVRAELDELSDYLRRNEDGR